MKKLLSILLTVCMMMTMIGAFAETETLIYASSFSTGNDGWGGRGSASLSHTAEGTLKTTGRSADWNSPGRNFDLVGGNEYFVSVDVLQNDAESAQFIVSLERTDAVNGTGWDRLVFGTVKKGEWTTISGPFTPGDFDSYLLYVETEGSPDLSYEIRNFRLESPNGIPAPKATEPPAVIEAVEDVPSLKDAYAGKFDFGVAAPQFAFQQKKLRELMIKHFSIITPENELKPDSVLDVFASRRLAKEKEDETAVAVHFDGAKALLNFAQENGIKVHGHVLVWHSQTPEAFFHEGYDANKPYVSREVMLGRLENYIKEVLTQSEEMYPGVIVSWDVVNEAIEPGNGHKDGLRTRGNLWYTVVGEDWIEQAFAFARKYAAEGVLLYYNDYSTADTVKLRHIVNLLEKLIPEGNIDGYGFQMHHDSGSPTVDAMTRAVEKIAALGVKLRVSELDVGISSYTDKALQAQANMYRAMMKLMLRFKDQTEAVQVWGLKDDMSWRNSNPTKYPLLFDNDLNPKPAFFAVIEAAAE